MKRDHLKVIRIGLDEFGTDGVQSIFPQLCYELEKIDHKSQPIPRIDFTCEDLAVFETLLLHILEHPDTHYRRIFARSRLVWDMYVHDIKVELQEALHSVPHTVVSPESGEAFALRPADRVTWLMLRPPFRSTWLDILLMDALGRGTDSNQLRTQLWADVRQAELLRIRIPTMYSMQIEDGVIARLGVVDVRGAAQAGGDRDGGGN
ncbi:hypothetical protein PsYK624_086940 [Phanerochaete sordida]|uniref:Uncharacterized protein n=1 Tax=Phanerochaete sordida TaxID=48140 RepID=A0A9P3GF13_9APHY|nr:hypothetical protein PsYK624_086940 [Phanerochaete sordida]